MPAPPHVNCLEVYTSNLCNLGCPACCVHVARGRTGRVRLRWEELERALEHFLDPARVPFAGTKFVAFAGGEPFLDFPLLLKAAERLARAPVPPRAFVYTNGTAAGPDAVRALAELGVQVIFSLDGARAANDRWRRFADDSARSVHETVLARLRGLPLEKLGTNTVLRPETLGGLVEAFDGFAKLGFGTIEFWPDYLRVWKAAELDRLRGFAAGFRAYYARRTREEGRIPFYTPMIHHALRSALWRGRGAVWWRDCFRLILGADGRYHDCQGAACFPYARARAGELGRPGAEPDWERRAAFMARADAALAGLGAERAWQHVCPRLYCKLAELGGGDPARAIANLHRVSAVLLGGLARLAEDLAGSKSFREAYLQTLPAPPCAAPAALEDPGALRRAPRTAGRGSGPGA